MPCVRHISHAAPQPALAQISCPHRGIQPTMAGDLLCLLRLPHTPCITQSLFHPPCSLQQVQIPLDALPEGSEMDANGNLLPLSSRDRPPLYQPGSCANLIDGDDMGLGLLGGDMVRQLQSADGAGEKEKRLKKLQKVNFCPACNPSPSVFSNLICNQALRQIGELKEKQAAGAVLEKTQVRLA